MSIWDKFKKKNEDWKVLLKQSTDYQSTYYINKKTNNRFGFHFYSTLIDEQIIQESALPPLLNEEFKTLDDIKKIVPIADVQILEDTTKIEEKLLNGYVMITMDSDKKKYAFVAAQKEIVRSLSQPEIEFSVIGPKEAFVESIGQNLNLIRKRLPIKELISQEFTVGELSKTRVAVLHIEGLTNKENVDTVKQRLENIKIDSISDSSYIVELLSDNSNSLFPQLLDTERPDRVAAILAEGKIAIIVDGSPHVLIAPTTLIEFFSAFEDYFLNWIIASFFRLVRVFAVFFSILVTPIYVAALTYHFELVPADLLGTLVTSRRTIPLPPILEALFLELTIELLREAGARLPTKVGQTIGIVGGIVIGTASVEAGLTSNVLLIFVALGALASFTTPVYKMSNTIRVLRFPFLLFAQIWGMLGIVFCFCILTAHLLRLTSLGRPFLAPIYPLRIKDMKDSVIRSPLQNMSRRPSVLRTQNPYRFNSKKAKHNKDIDE
ncbi:spore germination protein [Cytobacillus horneckiae]|uniref:spore germination protein n=1 Tax=Cytobacillus horneckiae TaxID=549687 RepID=UPI0039A09897